MLFVNGTKFLYYWVISEACQRCQFLRSSEFALLLLRRVTARRRCPALLSLLIVLVSNTFGSNSGERTLLCCAAILLSCCVIGRLDFVFSVHGSSAPPQSDFSLIRVDGHPCFFSGTAAFFLGFRGEAESCAHLN